MNEEDDLLYQSRWKPEDVLRGWSEGANEHPVPGGEAVTEEDWAKAREFWRQPMNFSQKQIPPSEQLTEFPLYYSKGRRDRAYWARRFNQLQAISDRVETFELVLAISRTKNETLRMVVIKADNIWKLLWLYLKSKIPKKKPKSKVKLPKYG